MTRVWGPDPGRDDDFGSIYRAVRDEQLHDDVPEQEDRGTATTMLPASTGRHEVDADTGEFPVQSVERSARTAGEQDHSNPWAFAGEVADPPVNPDGSEGPGWFEEFAPLGGEPGAVPRGATAWRNCAASLALVAEVNRRWPARDKASDGTIGDAAHATRTSDHNPWVIVAGVGVVRARDIDVDGVDMAWLMEHLRKLGAAGDRRLAGGGYLIFNRRITNPDFKAWRVYTGTNPHVAHGHVSFSTAQAGFDSTAGWGITAATPTPTPITPTGGFLMALSDAEQGELLALARNLNFQLYAGPNPKAPGWPTFGGGTNETLTVVDYLRRSNQQLEALKLKVAALETGKTGPPTLTNTDLDNIAARVVALLGKKASS